MTKLRGACAEVAGRNGAILVRDTTNRDGVTLTVPAPAWRAFTTEVRGNSGK